MAQVRVANIRCAEIMEEQRRSLTGDQAWASLAQESEAGLVPNFGSRAGALLASCITGLCPSLSMHDSLSHPHIHRATKAAHCATCANSIIPNPHRVHAARRGLC